MIKYENSKIEKYRKSWKSRK